MHTLLKFLAVTLIIVSCFVFGKRNNKDRLIGHRGGVVDSTYAENSMASLEEAYRRKYYMVEIDVRLSKDGQLITQHDDHFRKYFNLDSKPAEMPWDSIKLLHNNKGGGRPLLLEEVLQYCKGKMQIMVDNKITGNDTAVFRRMEELLRKYDLLNNAMFIGTEETRRYFYNKTNCGYSRVALLSLMKEPGFNAKKNYLFDHGNVLTKDDIDWANQNKITVVPSINKFHYIKESFMDGAKRDIANLRSWGVVYYQVDSEFDQFFN